MVTHRDFVMQAFDGYWGFIKENFGKERKVLDVGCRDYCMRGFLEGKGFVWTGTDVSPIGISGDILVCPMEDMKQVEDESFDLVFACHAFEHTERPVDSLREFFRVLKPGGYVFIAGPPHCWHHVLGADEDHIFVLTELQLERLLRYTGWGDIRVFLHPGDKEQNDTIVGVGRKPK